MTVPSRTRTASALLGKGVHRLGLGLAVRLAVRLRLSSSSAPPRAPAAPAKSASTMHHQRGCRYHRHHYHHYHLRPPSQPNRRWKSSSSSSSSGTGGGSKTKTKTKQKILPPLPPPTSEGVVGKGGRNFKETTSPAQAKRRYLESKRRTDLLQQRQQAEFLRDPGGKMSQLQNELDEVKTEAVRKLEREVYNKTVWQRLTDPIRRRQHSFINMVCATFAYVLAYNLHLKSKAHREAVAAEEEQRSRVQQLQALLRSLRSDTTVQEIADRTTTEWKQEGGNGEGGDVESTNANISKTVWGWFDSSTRSNNAAASATAAKTAAAADVDRDKLVVAIKSVLEEKIGDEGLDDETKKRKTIRNIWKNNEQQLRKQKQKQQENQQQQQQQQSKQQQQNNKADIVGKKGVTEEEELGDVLAAALPIEILSPSTDDDEDGNNTNSVDKAVVDSVQAAPTKKKRQRVFDM